MWDLLGDKATAPQVAAPPALLLLPHLLHMLLLLFPLQLRLLHILLLLLLLLLVLPLHLLLLLLFTTSAASPPRTAGARCRLLQPLLEPGQPTAGWEDRAGWPVAAGARCLCPTKQMRCV